MIAHLARAIAVVTAVLLLASCGEDTSEAPQSQTRTAPDGETFNDADVQFATEMIQHHAQALTMVDMTMDRALSPEVQQLTEQIRAAQGPEIEQMSDWLTSWEQPVPETVRDHSNAHGDGHGGVDSDMPGMMSEQQMSELDAAEGAEFEQLWLTMMIEHHEGAIEMAQEQQDDGESSQAIELAEAIEAAQQEEIETMQALLGT